MIGLLPPFARGADCRVYHEHVAGTAYIPNLHASVQIRRRHKKKSQKEGGPIKQCFICSQEEVTKRRRPNRTVFYFVQKKKVLNWTPSSDPILGLLFFLPAQPSVYEACRILSFSF